MLSIGTMAALCGTSVQTLRLYDKKGLLPAARIDPDSGYRYYTNGQIFLFQTIRLLQRTGMSLAEIRETLQKDPVDLRSLWDSQEKPSSRNSRSSMKWKSWSISSKSSSRRHPSCSSTQEKDRISNA